MSDYGNARAPRFIETTATSLAERGWDVDVQLTDLGSLWLVATGPAWAPTISATAERTHSGGWRFGGLVVRRTGAWGPPEGQTLCKTYSDAKRMLRTWGWDWRKVQQVQS